MDRKIIKQAFFLAGDEHKYQKFLIILLAAVWIQINFFFIGPSYLYMNPIFVCQNPEDQTLTESEICQILNQCQVADKFTLTYDLNLYCDQSWVRTQTQTIFSVGALFGLILVSLISDLRGRKPALLISLACLNVGGAFAFGGGFLQSSFLLMLSQLCAGFGAFSLVPLTYTILSDFSSFQLHQKGVTIFNFAWGLSGMTLGCLYIYQIHWSNYVFYFIIIPLLIISIFAVMLFIESPYVLMHKNDKQGVLESFEKICKFNGLQKNLPLIYEMIQNQNKTKIQERVEQNNLKNLVKIIKTKENLKPMLILMIIYCSANLYFYGLHYSLQKKGFGFGVNNIVIGIIEMTTSAYLNFAIHRIPRKYGMIILYLIVALLGLFFLIPSISSQMLLSSGIIGLSRVASNIAYTLFACMQTQSFKVQIQSTAAGFIQTFGIFGVFFAPLIVAFTQKNQLEPISINSILVILAVMSGFFLKQTLLHKDQSHQTQDRDLDQQLLQIQWKQK